MAVVIAATGFGVSAIIARQTARDAADHAHQAAEAAIVASTDAQQKSADASAELRELTTAVAGVRDAVAPFVPADAVTTLTARIDANTALVDGGPDSFAPSALAEVEDSMGVDELNQLAAALRNATTETEASTGEFDERRAEIEGAVEATDAALQAMAAAAGGNAGPLVEAAPLAEQVAKDSTTAAGAAAGAATGRAEVMTALTGYVAAAKTLADSQAAGAAAAAAAAEAAASASNGSSTGGSTRSGVKGSSGGGFSGGSSAGDGSSAGGGGGGSSSGGGGAIVFDQKRHVQTNSFYVPYSQCRFGGVPDGTHDPGPGGTSISSRQIPWSYTDEGTYIQFYIC